MDCYRLLHTLEAWVTGYRSEHYKLGLQQAICFALALLPIVVNKLYISLDRGGSSLYTAITVSATLLLPRVPPPPRPARRRPDCAGSLALECRWLSCWSPAQGTPSECCSCASWQLACLEALECSSSTWVCAGSRPCAAASPGRGMRNDCASWVLLWRPCRCEHQPIPPALPARFCLPAAVGNNAYNYDQFREEIGAWVITSLAVLGFVFMTNRQRYFKHHAFWNVALLTLPIVTVPAIRCGGRLFARCGVAWWGRCDETQECRPAAGCMWPLAAAGSALGGCMPACSLA